MKCGVDFQNQSLLKRWQFVVIIVTIGLLGLFAGAAMAASGGEGAKGWVATDTYKVINFTVLAVALFFLLKKPVPKALNARIQGIKDQISELEAKKKDAEDQLADYKEKFQKLEKEAETLIEEYIRQGKEAKTKIIQEAEAAADKLEAQARRNIENEYQKAKARLKSEAIEEALAKAEEIIKQKVTTEDQERLVDEYLEKVVAQ